MKTLIAGIVAALLLTGVSLSAADAPRGELLELHSCQLYIGGCIASSEITQEGQYQLRVWNFDGGAYEGTQLHGLQVALLEVADQNLAVDGSRPTDAVAYLPRFATRTETAALIDWLKRINPELARTKLQVRTTPMSFAHTGATVSFSAGQFLQIETRPFEPCGLVSCGESLWYAPRSMLTSYTVGVTRKAVVHEPALALRWVDHDKNNVFDGRFGEGTTTRAAFTPPALVCADNHTPHE